jgi:uncharacterized protein DUF3489
LRFRASRSIDVLYPTGFGIEKSNHSMSAFTIDADNNITVHPNRKIARRTGAGVFDSAESFAELIGADNKRGVEIWNSLTGVRPVKKFTSGAVAARRIFAEVQKLAAPAGLTAAEPQAAAPAAMHSSPPTAAVHQRASKKAPGKVAKATKAETRPGSKKEIVLGLISRKGGASLGELMSALQWQKHSVRGFIATLGKMVSIESFMSEQGVRTYKIS